MALEYSIATGLEKTRISQRGEKEGSYTRPDE